MWLRPSRSPLGLHTHAPNALLGAQRVPHNTHKLVTRMCRSSWLQTEGAQANIKLGAPACPQWAVAGSNPPWVPWGAAYEGHQDQ